MYPHHLHHHHHRPFPDICRVPPQMQLVEIILLRDELIHDIEANINQLERKATVPSASPEGSSPLLPNGASDNYLISRHIDTAVNSAVSRCQAYLLLPSPYVHRISTDHAHQWEEKSLYLALPPDWPPHCIDPLRDAVHNYVVYRAMQLFLTFANEKAAATADAMASDSYDDINVQISARRNPLSCGFSPFG